MNELIFAAMILVLVAINAFMLLMPSVIIAGTPCWVHLKIWAILGVMNVLASIVIIMLAIVNDDWILILLGLMLAIEALAAFMRHDAIQDTHRVAADERA